MNNKRGVALVFAMLIIILLSLAVGVSIFLARTTGRLTGKVTARKAESYIAEAAVQEVLWKLHNFAAIYNATGNLTEFGTTFDELSEYNDTASSGTYTATIDNRNVTVTIGPVLGSGSMSRSGDVDVSGTREIKASITY